MARVKKKSNPNKLPWTLLSIVVGVMIALMGANYTLEARRDDAAEKATDAKIKSVAISVEAVGATVEVANAAVDDKIGMVREDIRDLKQVLKGRRVDSDEQRELIAEVRRHLAAIDARLESMEP